MSEVLWYVLPLAIAVSVSIFPLLATLVLLLSRDPVPPSVAYAAGWSVGLVLLVTLFTLGANLLPNVQREHLPRWVHIVEIAVGAAITIGAVVAIVLGRRRKDGEAAVLTSPVPKSATSLGAGRAFALGIAMNLRPKNLVLTFAAGLAIGSAPIDLPARVFAALVFTIVGVSAVVGLVVAYLIGGARMRPLLDRLNQALVAHAGLILRLTLVVVGVALIVIGIVDLTADY